MKFKIGDLVHTTTNHYTITNSSTICEVVAVHQYSSFMEIIIKAWKPHVNKENSQFVDSAINRKEKYEVEVNDFDLYKPKQFRKITI